MDHSVNIYIHIYNLIDSCKKELAFTFGKVASLDTTGIEITGLGRTGVFFSGL